MFIADLKAEGLPGVRRG